MAAKKTAGKPTGMAKKSVAAKKPQGGAAAARLVHSQEVAGSIPVPATIDRVELYVLRDPDTGMPRYAGKANDAAARLKTHVRDSRRRRTPLYAWLQKLQAQGQTPTLSVVGSVPSSCWQEAERHLIRSLRAAGAPMLNIADGGDEPFCSHSTRAANGAAVARTVHSDPIRRRLWELKKQAAVELSWLVRNARNSTAGKLRAAMRQAGWIA